MARTRGEIWVFRDAWRDPVVKNCGGILPEIPATKKQTIGQFQRRKPQKQIAIREGSATLLKNRFRRFPRSLLGEQKQLPKKYQQKSKNKKKRKNKNIPSEEHTNTSEEKTWQEFLGKRLERSTEWGRSKEGGWNREGPGMLRSPERLERPLMQHTFRVPVAVQEYLKSCNRFRNVSAI